MNLSIQPRFGACAAVLPLCLLLLAPAVTYAEKDAPAKVFAGEVNLSVWRKIPVYHNGRPQPLDTYANRAKDLICDREKSDVSLNLYDYVEIKKGGKQPDVSASEYAPALPLFPDNGKGVKWSSTEILLSWLTEADKWEVVPFILAQHEELRKVLGVPTFNGRNVRLKYVSPAQVARSEGFVEYLEKRREREIEARREGDEYEKTELDELADKVLRAYSLFRSITFDATAPLTHTPIMKRGSRSRFVRHYHEIAEVALASGEKKLKLMGMLQELSGASDEKTKNAANAMLQALGRLGSLGKPLDDQYAAASGDIAPAADGEEPETVELQDALPTVLELRAAAVELEKVMQEVKDRIYDSAEFDKKSAEKLGPIFRAMRFKSAEIKRLSFEMHVALYDENNGLLVTPAMNPAALTKTRDTSNTAQPWLSLQTLLHARTQKPGLLAPYPENKINAVRNAWKALSAAYLDRADKQRWKKCNDAQLQLSNALRNLGDGIEEQREDLVRKELPGEERDDSLLKYTAYPSTSRMDSEVLYNTLQPFRLSFGFCFLALAAFAISLGPYGKRVAFWTGATLLAATIVWTIYAFYLRVAITQWAPVTNMWETVVFVPFVIVCLGLWFMVLPIIWPGIRDAWRLTAIPFSWEAAELTPAQLEKMPAGSWFVGGAGMLIGRVAGMAFFVWLLMIAPYADGGRAIFPLWPRLDHLEGGAVGGGTIDKFFVWGMGLICVALSTWFLPRVLMMSLALPVMAPWNIVSFGSKRGAVLGEVYKRVLFGLGAAGFASLLFMAATFSPPDSLDENFSPLQPVLRSNFWLTIHVLTIVASYGAGFLALAMGFIGCMVYLFGSYRDPVVHAKTAEALTGTTPENLTAARRRPPEECVTLANYAYRCIQVAVLLLAAGTMLGGFWADVSWGRFWGWDPKEVWALISLLVYLGVLHGRFAGWFNTFGLIAGTVLGGSMIIFSWYGVNFILPTFAGGDVGLHSYGTGAGGLGWVIGFVVVMYVALAAASVRYFIEMAPKVASKKVE